MKRGKSVWVYYYPQGDLQVHKEIIRLARKYKGTWEGSGSTANESDISFYFSHQKLNNARNFARQAKKLFGVKRVSIFASKD
jgi:hypothetical protein